MLSDLVGLIVAVAPFLALLVWREQVERRQHAAALVRADLHAGAVRALGGESLLAINVQGRARLLVLQAPRSDRRNAAQHVPREVGVLGPRLP